MLWVGPESSVPTFQYFFIVFFWSVNVINPIYKFSIMFQTYQDTQALFMLGYI